MKNTIAEEKLRYELLKLFCYMITSARGLIDASGSYGPFRLLDSVERLITLLDNQGLADDFLKEKQAEIATGKFLSLAGLDQEKFIEFVDKLVIDFTKQLKREGQSQYGL